MMAETVLITGASSGIGLELAKIFAAAKYCLILTARNQAALETLAEECRKNFEVEVVVIPADLSTTAAVGFVFGEVQRLGLSVDVLVNNAGFGNHGRFWENEIDKELSLIQVNIHSLVHLTRLILPGMVSKKAGRILNVASTAAFQPGPLMANYYASKAYVLSFSEALSSELAHKGVTVTALCPGPTVTDFQNRAGIAESPLFKMAGLSAKQVAQAGFDATMRGKRVCIPGWRNWFGTMLVKFVPKPILLSVVKKMQASR